MIQIPRDTLKNNQLEAEDIIRILNSFPLQEAPPPPQPQAPILGQIGEKKIVESIRGFECIKPGPHSGDLIVWRKSHPEIRIMLEIKNYSHRVPREQYEKFLRDLEPFSGGIFVSNEPISGLQLPPVFENIIILQSHDADLVQLACETLWVKLLEQQKYTFIQTPNSECASSLVETLETLARIKIATEGMRKNIQKASDRILLDIERALFRTREVAERLVREHEPSKIFYGRIRLPEEIVEPFREPLNRFIQKYFGEAAALIRRKNVVEISGAEKKLAIGIFRTKIELTFAPSTWDFRGISHLSCADGLVTFALTKKNILSDIWENIHKLF